MDRHVAVEFLGRSWKVDANRARFGLMILLPAYALVTAWTLGLVIFFAPLEAFKLSQVSAEWQGNEALQEALRESASLSPVLMEWSLLLLRFLIPLISAVIVPAAMALWLGMLFILYTVSRRGPVDALRMYRALKVMAVLSLLSIPLAVLGSFAAGDFFSRVIDDQAGVPLGFVYGIFIMICILLCFSRLQKLAQQLERHLDPQERPKRSFLSMPEMLAITIGMLLLLIILIVLSLFLPLTYMIALVLIVLLAGIFGWLRSSGGMLNLWRWRDNGLGILAVILFATIFIGMGALALYDLMNFRSFELSELLTSQSGGSPVSSFVWMSLPLLPLALPLLVSMLGLGSIHVRLQHPFRTFPEIWLQLAGGIPAADSPEADLTASGSPRMARLALAATLLPSAIVAVGLIGLFVVAVLMPDRALSNLSYRNESAVFYAILLVSIASGITAFLLGVRTMIQNRRHGHPPERPRGPKLIMALTLSAIPLTGFLGAGFDTASLLWLAVTLLPFSFYLLLVRTNRLRLPAGTPAHVRHQWAWLIGGIGAAACIVVAVFLRDEIVVWAALWQIALHLLLPMTMAASDRYLRLRQHFRAAPREQAQANGSRPGDN